MIWNMVKIVEVGRQARQGWLSKLVVKISGQG